MGSEKSSQRIILDRYQLGQDPDAHLLFKEAAAIAGGSEPLDFAASLLSWYDVAKQRKTVMQQLLERYKTLLSDAEKQYASTAISSAGGNYHVGRVQTLRGIVQALEETIKNV